MDVQAIDKTFVIGALKEKVCKIVFTKRMVKHESCMQL